MRALLASPELPGGLQAIARGAATALRSSAPGGAAVLTDDRAPVEQLTHRMIVRRDRLLAGP